MTAGKSAIAIATDVALLAAALVLCGRAAGAADLRGQVLDGNGNPLADAVVFAQQVPPGVPTETRAPLVEMDQIHKQFVPHLLPITVGTSVHFPNRDQIHHHVYSLSRTKTFEIPLHKGEKTDPVLFDKVGVVKVGCNIHDWMSGVILVLPNPYFATTDTSGFFTLSGLTPGDYSFAAWHERAEGEPEQSAQKVVVRDDTPPLTFKLVVKPAPRRAPMHGLRGY
jgi:plastocyanin